MKDRRNVALLFAVGALLLWTLGAQATGWSVFAVVAVVLAVLIVAGLLVERELRFVGRLTKDLDEQQDAAARGATPAADGPA